MQVYKAYFKIIRKHLFPILLFFTVFVLIAILISNSLGGTTAAAFTVTKSKVAFFSEEDTPMVQGLKDYLQQNTTIVSLPDDQQKIQDALFFGQAEYIIRVPAGFTQSFLNGSNAVKIQKTAAAGSKNSVYMDFLLNKYLQTAGLYVQNLPSLSQDQLVSEVSRDLKLSATVTLESEEKPAGVNDLSYYFQTLAYAIMAIMIMAITTVMMAFNEKDLSNRNLCSPLKPFFMNLQMVLCNATLALVVWAALCAVVFQLYGQIPINTGTILLALNALVFTLVALSIGFIGGKFISNAGVQNAFANVLSLGLSFIGGVFVPQELLGKTVLTISSFTPSYWYIKAVNDIRNSTVFNTANTLPILYSMLIQLGFAVVLVLIALLLTKQKRMSRA